MYVIVSCYNQFLAILILFGVYKLLEEIFSNEKFKSRGIDRKISNIHVLVANLILVRHVSNFRQVVPAFRYHDPYASTKIFPILGEEESLKSLGK